MKTGTIVLQQQEKSAFLTQISQVDFRMDINRTSPFQTLRVLGGTFFCISVAHLSRRLTR